MTSLEHVAEAERTSVCGSVVDWEFGSLMVGDESAARQAVLSEPRASGRHVNLDPLDY
jgi:hypothetical protein